MVSKERELFLYIVPLPYLCFLGNIMTFNIVKSISLLLIFYRVWFIWFAIYYYYFCLFVTTYYRENKDMY